ncbi:DUF4131 domain-containing protein [Methylomonas sp. TEB]|uniref:ComEC/Rec2 family competence protein n=1 Tax=Methylomonas sp. TEB TaxID=3398229 RepID=UPI0039F50DC4
MNLSSLLFLAGIVAVQQFSRLPSLFEFIGLVVSGLLLIYRHHWRFFALLAGVLWASLLGGWRLSQQLPDTYQNQEVKIQGYIASLPQQQEQRTNFDFIVTAPSGNFPDKIRLSWYYPKLNLAAGQGWEFRVKLRRPHGRLNPGGFDFEAWLFANHIGATGYVRDKPPPQIVSLSPSIGQYFARCRQAIADRLDAALPGSGQLGVIKALTIGSQNAITQEQWRVFRLTGVVHLIVIIYLLKRKFIPSQRLETSTDWIDVESNNSHLQNQQSPLEFFETDLKLTFWPKNQTFGFLNHK